jgi:hypothetical protein
MVLNRIYSVKQLYYLYYSIYIYIYIYMYIYIYKEEWSICTKKPQRPPMEI